LGYFCKINSLSEVRLDAVYDISVKDDTSYVTSNYAVHNSVGGSLTAYVNEIHQAYPKKYQLIFARFLNKYKEAFPDIDNDIAPSGRYKLHNYLRSKYGEGNVAHVSNINTITPKVYARDIARVFEFDGSRSAAAEKGNLIADSIPAEMHTVKQALEEAPLFVAYAEQYPELAEFAELLCGLPRAWSTHAGGIIISKKPLEGLVPLRRDISGALVLEYDKEIAEENGLVKIDTLGVETLDIIGETYKIIKDTGKEISADPFDYEITDSLSYNLIGDGDTFGVFQLGSTAIPVCKKVRPHNVADIALVSALVRPAAKDTIPDLLKVRNGDTKMNLMHPTLERAFASTYGYGLYEESLMYLAQDVAGWDLHDADKLRKLTKEKGKNPEKVKKWREEFIEGAQKNKGLSEEIATRVWDETIAQFGGYGFNRCLQYDCKIDTFTEIGKFITSKPIKDVQPGEFVRSRDEETGKDIYIEVIGNHDHGELEVVEVELETGERVKCTMNHKFRTVETGEMLPLHQILKDGLSIVVSDVIKDSGI
jgi:DNA polymerase-3 subunit alpha